MKLEQHPLTQAAMLGKKTVDFLTSLDETNLGLASLGLATALSALIELAPDNDCRCYVLSHHLCAILSAKNTYGISDSDFEKQLAEVNEELGEFMNLLLVRMTEGKRAN